MIEPYKLKTSEVITSHDYIRGFPQCSSTCSGKGSGNACLVIIITAVDLLWQGLLSNYNNSSRPALARFA